MAFIGILEVGLSLLWISSLWEGVWNEMKDKQLPYENMIWKCTFSPLLTGQDVDIWPYSVAREAGKCRL